jgi:hypothetical protein
MCRCRPRRFRPRGRHCRRRHSVGRWCSSPHNRYRTESSRRRTTLCIAPANRPGRWGKRSHSSRSWKRQSPGRRIQSRTGRDPSGIGRCQTDRARQPHRSCRGHDVHTPRSAVSMPGWADAGAGHATHTCATSSAAGATVGRVGHHVNTGPSTIGKTRHTSARPGHAAAVRRAAVQTLAAMGVAGRRVHAAPRA